MSQYQPKKGEEKYAAVRVTKKNGQQLSEPQVELYDPAVLKSVLALNGFEGEVVHDPRTSAQKAEKVSASTVKYTKALDSDEDYKARYSELFKQEVPFNLTLTEIRSFVDAAEAKLPLILSGATLVDERVYLTDGASVTADELTVPTEPVAPTEPTTKAKK